MTNLTFLCMPFRMKLAVSCGVTASDDTVGTYMLMLARVGIVVAVFQARRTYIRRRLSRINTWWGNNVGWGQGRDPSEQSIHFGLAV